MKIFEFLGTPGEEKNYKMYKKYNEYTKDIFFVYPGKKIEDEIVNLGKDGADLLKKLLEYDPNLRISAKEALEHPFFNDLDERTKKLYV